MKHFALVLLALWISVQPAAAFTSLFGGGMEKATAKDGVVSLSVASLQKGESKHYRFEQDGKTIRFFLVRDNQNAVHVALDACDVCWREDKGYVNKNGAMLCVNCGQQFAYNRIGQVRGGCNPHPVPFEEKAETVTISAQTLLDNAGYFPGNSR